MAIGYGLKKIFDLNISTLAKVQFYVLIPALLFTSIYESELDKAFFLSIAIYSTVIFGLLYVISWIAAKSLRYTRSSTSAFVNSIAFYNSGNYCLPLVQLLYNSSYAIAIQFIIMMVQNILTNTLGIFNSNIGNKDWKKAVTSALKVPLMYSIILALTLKWLQIPIWKPLWNSIDTLGNAMIAIALLTLGAQLADTRISFTVPRVYLSSFLRLIVGPILALLVVLIFDIKGVAAQILIISAAAPTAVNTVLLSIEYDNEPEFASQAVFTSTILSAITVSAVIFLVTTYMPV